MRWISMKICAGDHQTDVRLYCYRQDDVTSIRVDYQYYYYIK